MNSDVLWEGKIYVNSAVFSGEAYARVYSHRISITKSVDNTEPLIELDKSSVSSVKPPKFEFDQIWSGPEGFHFITEDENGQPRNIKFWPKGLGKFPSEREMKKLIRVIGDIYSFDKSQIESLRRAYSPTSFILIIASSIFGACTSGFFGIIIMAIASFAAYKVWSSEKYSNTVRGLIAAGIYIAGLLVSLMFAIVIAIVFAIGN